MVRPRRHDDPPGPGFRNGPPYNDAPYHSYGGPGRGDGYGDNARRPFDSYDSYDSYRPGPPRFNDNRFQARPPPPRDFRGGPGGPRHYSDYRRPPPPRDFAGTRDSPQGVPPWELRQRGRHNGFASTPAGRGMPELFSSRASAPAPREPSGARRGASPHRPSTSHRSPHSAPRSPRAQVILPPDEYVGFSSETNVLSEEVVPKLLVLDLNGALVYRSAGSGKQRRAYPRPFLHNFLEYLFGPEADGRAWEVFVWSSAQPHNVRHMVETTFGPVYSRGIWDQAASKKPSVANQNPDEIALDGEGDTHEEEQGHLLGVWARDKMALGDNYFKKVQTQKDLRKVIDHLGQFDEKRVVLLDDSPLKGVYQPWSQIVITEYDKPEFADSKDAVMRLAERTKDLKIQSEPPTESETDSPAARSPNQPTEAASTTEPTPEEKDAPNADAVGVSNTDVMHEPGLDTTLLAVVGILEAMRNVQNVPAFIRGGGVLNPSSELLVEGDVSATTLPSHETFAHWFTNAETLDYWTQRGKEALQRRGIELNHGMRFSPSGEFFPLNEPTEESPAAAPGRSTDGGEGKVEIKGKLLKGKKAEAAYRHLQAVAEGDLVSEHQRSAVWAALQVLKDVGLAPATEGFVGTSDPISQPEVVNETPDTPESKKRPRSESVFSQEPEKLS